MKTVLLAAFAAVSAFVCSCNSAECKSAAISGHVNHHVLKIPYASIFIKKGTKDAPGTDTNLCDINAQSDANGRFSIASLETEDYDIMGWGYDSAISGAVHRGIPFTVGCDEESKTYNIDVPAV